MRRRIGRKFFALVCRASLIVLRFLSTDIGIIYFLHRYYETKKLVEQIGDIYIYIILFCINFVWLHGNLIYF